jgi:hypothetical protein
MYGNQNVNNNFCRRGVGIFIPHVWGKKKKRNSAVIKPTADQTKRWAIYAPGSCLFN